MNYLERGKEQRNGKENKGRERRTTM